MKYIKLFMLLAVTAFFAACSDDDASWNTNADVTVEMGKTEVKVKEGAGLFNVPIVVKGETTAPVRVHVSMRESGSNPAKKDVNYIVTDTTIVISDGAGKVEVKTVDDEEINENRTFEVYIVSADGAKVGANSSTNVVLRDNDSEFYEKLQGVWKMKCVDTKGAAKEWSVIVTGGDEESEDYNHYLYVSGMMGYDWTKAVLKYDYDKATKQGSLAFDELGSYKFADGVDFGLGNTPNYVCLYQSTSQGLTTEPIDGSWSADFKTVTFDPDKVLAGAIFGADGTFMRAAWFQVKSITMTR